MLDFIARPHYNGKADKLTDTFRAIRSCRVVGRARTIGNRVGVKSSSRVRISPTPPKRKSLPLAGSFFLPLERFESSSKAPVGPSSSSAHTGRYLYFVFRSHARKTKCKRISPTPRQKNSTPFRFRGPRKYIALREHRTPFKACRENCISVESFFLLQIGPASLGSDLGMVS